MCHLPPTPATLFHHRCGRGSNTSSFHRRGGDSHSFATINFDWRLLLRGKRVGAMAFPLATVGDQATSCLNAWWKEGGVGIGNPCNNFREIWRTENIRGARHKNEQQSIQHNIGGKDTINNKIMQKLGHNRTMHKDLK